MKEERGPVPSARLYLSKMRVKKLVEECRKRGVEYRGLRKEELLRRLTDHLDLMNKAKPISASAALASASDSDSDADSDAASLDASLKMKAGQAVEVEWSTGTRDSIKIDEELVKIASKVVVCRHLLGLEHPYVRWGCLVLKVNLSEAQWLKAMAPKLSKWGVEVWKIDEIFTRDAKGVEIVPDVGPTVMSRENLLLKPVHPKWGAETHYSNRMRRGYGA